MEKRFDCIIKKSNDVRYVLVTKGQFYLECVVDAIDKIRMESPWVQKIYFDFIITNTTNAVACRRSRFQCVEIVGDMILVYELSYLHNGKFKAIFNPLIESLDLSEKGLKLENLKIDAEDKRIDFKSLDETVPYAKIRLI